MRIMAATIASVFILQVVTGLLLMTAYSPSTTTAWGSVWYIQTQAPGGWFLRGLHHFASDALIVLLVAYLAQRLLRNAYAGGHRAAWWGGLVGLGLALGLSLTGHLLPWDQEGYWGTVVRTNILARTPVVGPWLAEMLVGGREPGNLTITRFYTLHVVLLPLALAWIVFRPLRRAQDPTTATPRAEPGPCTAAPSRSPLRPALASAAVIAALVVVAWVSRSVIGSQLLDAPADRAALDYPARPEWHTRFLFQWLKAFEGPTAEVVGAIVVPGAVAAVLFLFPFLSRVFPARWERRVSIGFAGTAAAAIVFLTAVSYLADLDPADARVARIVEKKQRGENLTTSEESVLSIRHFNDQRRAAGVAANRALELAGRQGVPPEGPLALLANDPLTRGLTLFAAHCAACHRYDGHDGLGRVPQEPAASSDLAGYGTRTWIRGLLEDPMNERYFGRMKTPEGEPAHTRMARVVEELYAGADDATRPALLADLDAVALFLEHESGRAAPDEASKSGGGMLERGRDVFMEKCNLCHTYEGQRTGSTHAPEMRGYASIEWIELMIAEPDHETRYRSTGREKARMPRFKERLSDTDRKMLAEWLHGSVR